MTAWKTAILLLLPAVGLTQSLGDTARQEAARRKKVQGESKPAAVLSDDALEKAAAARRRTESTTGEGAASERDTDGRSGEAAPTRTVTQDAQDLDRERAERERDEQTWRKRMADANARLERARERYDAVKDVPLIPGQQLVDGSGHVVAGSAEQLRSLAAAAEAELRAAEKALEDLADTAQREGVPPGWLR